MGYPDQYAQALSKEDGISLDDAKAVVPTYKAYVTPAEPSDIQAEQSLSAAFVEAGPTKQ